MKNDKFINVYYNNTHTGVLAKTQNGLIAFEYSDEFIQSGFSISPLSLPLIKKLYLPKDYFTFQGLFGVFNDSLPDGWGRLIVDRYLSSKGINPHEVSLLDRLAVISDYGMGALEYKPEYEVIEFDNSSYDLDKLSKDCANLFEDKQVDNIDELFNMAGSVITGKGARKLASLVGYLGDPGFYRVVVAGYTDNTGSAEYCLEHSGKRAVAVADWLRSKMDGAEILDFGMGNESPLLPNNTFANRAVNRRVEVLLVPGDGLISQAWK